MRNRIIHAFAGTMILVSILLSIYVSQNWLWLTGFVGINLLQSSVTNWCLLDKILTKMGYSNEDRNDL
ncbi:MULTISPECIES: DUF2892 domain-containing protein [Chryseobacterium]|uniref:Inner membrane protein YgaP-like transmembrane domain-containing protein n=1 Tax=Chryseobacterium salivictor TaxID=2547600 RepID=A0A4P6ZCB9_9FLAO|nr:MULTISPECIES: DUF2892 domain-containing protein [Chryseobacterium]MDQ0477835.1 hypothetical protein [Chryseobacterium sp. MDT2-18]QBO57029.1 hypothetical protein NBC122_00171 [Chryseobacterium salivictor]